MTNIYNNSGPQKPQSDPQKYLKLGLSASASIVTLQSLADSAATAGYPEIQITLLAITVILAFYGQLHKDHQNQATCEKVSDLNSELTALRIREYRLKYELTRKSRRLRPGKNRI